MHIRLLRLEESEEYTIGVLLLNGEYFCVTLENPWKDNQKNISSIPTGNYICAKHESERFGATYRVKDVPGREGIIFHIGNTADDTQGCILLGNEFGVLGHKKAVLGSRHTFREFKLRLGTTQCFVLEVESCKKSL